MCTITLVLNVDNLRASGDDILNGSTIDRVVLTYLLLAPYPHCTSLVNLCTRSQLQAFMVSCGRYSTSSARAASTRSTDDLFAHVWSQPSCIRPSCIRPHRSSMTCECVTCVNYSCACTGQRLNQGSPFPTPVTLARLTWSFPVLRVGNWRASFFYAYMLTLAGEVSHAYPPRSVKDQICLDRKKNVGYGYL